MLRSWPKFSIGSDHNILHMRPDVGGSRNRSSCRKSVMGLIGERKEGCDGVGLTLRISSIVRNSGDMPPCMHKNCLFKIAMRGKAQNDSMHASYTRSEYLCLHSFLNVK